MAEVTLISVDLAKRVFQAHGAAADGSVIFRRKLPRDRFLSFLADQPRCVVAMEACATSHGWGREIERLGHSVRLIPPIYVKPFVKLCSSWLNLVERFFAEITARRIRRGSYSSVDDLEAAIYDYLAQHNENPKPFRWTKTAEDILTRERRALNALDETRGNR
ncbi:MAG: transposase [Rhodobacteraceae bacterium]|nr:transposase [Paracoccaceae bacterium]